jgi:hypothetical protein
VKLKRYSNAKELLRDTEAGLRKSKIENNMICMNKKLQLEEAPGVIF